MVAIGKWTRNVGQQLRSARNSDRKQRISDYSDPTSAVGTVYRTIDEAIDQGIVNARELSVQQMFIDTVPNGREVLESWGNTRTGARFRGEGVMLTENINVNTADFSNIMGQIVYSEVKGVFAKPDLIGMSLVTTMPSSFIDGEKIPGISEIGDDFQAIGEGENYPAAGVSEEWIETPRTEKMGLTVNVTKEAIIADRTGLLLDRVNTLASALAMNREKRILDTVLGIVNSYSRNGGPRQATYAATHTQGDFNNLLASNPLVDWTSVDAALLKFDAMNDPNTREPIIVASGKIVIPNALINTARFFKHSTEIRQGSSAASTQQRLMTPPSGVSDFVPNLANDFSIVGNAYVSRRAGNSTSWWVGDFPRAFRYVQIWPPQSEQAPPNNELEFSADIVQRYKISERGIPAVVEPRYVVQVNAT